MQRVFQNGMPTMRTQLACLRYIQVLADRGDAYCYPDFLKAAQKGNCLLEIMNRYWRETSVIVVTDPS
jgi:uncharacterized membrane protein